jgi:hypothetical protein
MTRLRDRQRPSAENFVIVNTGRTAVFVVWDEDSYIPNIVIAPSVIPGTSTSTAVNHYGLLRATEEMLGLPLLGNAAGATPLRTVFHI